MSKKRKKKKGGRPSKNTANAKLLKDRVRGVFAQHLGERPGGVRHEDVELGDGHLWVGVLPIALVTRDQLARI